MQFSLYDLYTEHKEITNHAKLKERFNTAIKNLTEESKDLLKWSLAVKANGGIGASAKVSTIIMDKRTALWFSSKLNDELRLALILKVEEMDKPEPKQLSFNEQKIQALSKVYDGMKTVADSINALQDDTKALQAPVSTQTPEVIEAIAYVEEKASEAKDVVHGRRTAEIKYRGLKRYNLIDFNVDTNPKLVALVFEYWTPSQCIITTSKGVSHRIQSPAWIRLLGDFDMFKANVMYRNTKSKAFLDLVEITHKYGDKL